MSASDHLQPEQLRMFMTPREIVEGGRFAPSDKQYGESVGRMWQRKLKESQRPPTSRGHGAGLYDSIARSGVQSPVELYHGNPEEHDPDQVWDGHHRLASAYATRPDAHIPVEHTAMWGR